MSASYFQPSKILCIGRNYAEHAAELGNDVPAEPLVFFKPPSALIPPDSPIILPRIAQRVDFEGELAVVIGQRCRFVAQEDANQVVAGYTLLNDVTARDLQKKDGQWARAKGFDTFAPCGPVMVSDLDVADLEIKTLVNGELRQHGRTSQLIFSIPKLIAHLSEFCTLEAGDIIATGTPSGVGPLHPGDIVRSGPQGLVRCGVQSWPKPWAPKIIKKILKIKASFESEPL